MRKTYCIAALLLAVLLVCPASSQMVTADEAAVVASNWVRSVIESRGSWGGSASAEIGAVAELRYDGRHVGHLFPVTPTGFVVVSLRQEFAPVKAYSEESSLDPSREDGPSDLLRGKMARVIEGAEALSGQPIDAVRAGDLTAHVEIDYTGAWERLQRGTIAFPQLRRDALRGGYQEGDVMLSTEWDQKAPYNDDCPDLGCYSSGLPGYNTNALVGCVATAGAQIMNYWSWPPYGVGSPYGDAYDWPNMFDDCYYHYDDSCFADLTDSTYFPFYPCLTQSQVDAAAELCAEIGDAVAMDYGCELSSAHTYNMEGVYENSYRYDSACGVANRSDNSASEWFTIIKTQCNANRPMQYRILKHSIVCDGWQEPGGIPQYHMNYGWNNPYNAWYTLDALHYPAGGSIDDEYVIRSIYPNVGIGASFAGTLGPSGIPYRYFMVDTEGASATFTAGQNLQFLPGVVVGCSSGDVTVESGAAIPSRLFSHGDLSKGAKLSGGTMKIMPGGEVTVR